MQRGLEAKSLFLHMSWAGLEGEPDGNDGRNSRCDQPCRLRKKGGLNLLGDGSREAMQMFWTLSLILKTRMIRSDVRGRE